MVEPLHPNAYKTLLELLVREAKAEALIEAALNIPDVVPSQVAFLRDRIDAYKRGDRC